MDSSIDRERIAKQIVKTRDSIRRKYHALKTGKMNQNSALERHFKPIIEPLKLITENTKESIMSKIEPSENEHSLREEKNMRSQSPSEKIKRFVL